MAINASAISAKVFPSPLSLCTNAIPSIMQAEDEEIDSAAGTSFWRSLASGDFLFFLKLPSSVANDQRSGPIVDGTTLYSYSVLLSPR